MTPALGLSDSKATLEELVVEMAETPQKHATIARYCRAKAEEARAEAARHDRMGKSYHSGKMPQRHRMKQQCQKISKRCMAMEYDDLAELHAGEAE